MGERVEPRAVLVLIIWSEREIKMRQVSDLNEMDEIEGDNTTHRQS